MRRVWIFAGMAVLASVMMVTKAAGVCKPSPAARGDAKIQENAASASARLLKAMEGTWTITDTLSPDAKNPKGVQGAGTIVWRPGPGGFSVVEEFHSKQGEQDVNGLGMMWWDEGSKGFHTIWCDSTNPGGCIDFKNVARWEGPDLVLQEDYELNGKKFTFKEVFGEFSELGFKQTLYGGEAGKDLKVDEVIEAKRKM